MAKKPQAPAPQPPKENPVSETPDFNALLSRPADSFKEPPTWPAGTYHGVVAKYEYIKSVKKQTPGVRYSFNIHEAGEDVDAQELEGIELSKRQLHTDFYVTEDATYRLTNFLKSCGVNLSGRGLGETIPEVVGCEVSVYVTQRMEEVLPGQPVPESPRKFNDVKSVAGTGG